MENRVSDIILEKGCGPIINQWPITGITNSMKQIHGDQVADYLKVFMNTTKDLSVALARRRYLLHCRTYDMFPKHIINVKMKLLNNTNFYSNLAKKLFNKLVDKFCKNILNTEITDICTHIKYLDKNLTQVKCKLNNSSIDKVFLSKFFVTQTKKFEYISEKYNNVLLNKFYNHTTKNTQINLDSEVVNLKNSWFKNLIICTSGCY